MGTGLFAKKQSEDRDEKRKASFNRIVLFSIIILFFSGIAALSFFLERPNSKYIITNTQSVSCISGISSSIINIESSSSAPVISGAVEYPVYIVGEINKPGIYKVRTGIFLYQLVDLAGGLTSKAAKNSINLAFQITRNLMIKIPSQDEVKDGRLGGIEEGLLLKNENGIGNDEVSDLEPLLININKADINELDELPGIGAATAKLIIDFRTKNGEFKIIEDIMKIPGIKESKFNQIKDRISVK